MPKVTRVVIVGGGPGGYEAALVASQLGGEVTLVDSDGLGGSAVLLVAAVLGLATGPFRVQQARWQRHTQARLRLAEQWAAG